jgi:hypothetical protein
VKEAAVFGSRPLRPACFAGGTCTNLMSAGKPK